MAILKEEIKGTKILNEIESSNITRTEYDTQSKEMVVEFKKGNTRYVYEGVPHQVYTKFRMAESQGKFFTTEISKKFPFKKLG
jgi:predicted Ser/Thr protein kinase